MKDCLLVLSAMAMGWCWGHSLSTLPLVSSLLIPVLWSCASNRLSAALIPALYAMCATRGLIQGSATFFDKPIAFGVLLWALSGLPHALAGALAFCKDKNKRIAVGIPFLCILLILPPALFVGWVHPLLSSGIVFPNTGIAGFVYGLLLMMLCAYLTNKLHMFVRFIALVLALAIYNNTAQNINQTPNFYAHPTEFSQVTLKKPQEIIARHWQLQNEVQQAGVHVFPESIGGVWDDFIGGMWQKRIPEQAQVLIGANIYTNHEWQNVMILINQKEHKVFYLQRLPMTAGMFNPFSKDNYPARFWQNNSVVRLGDQRLGIALCFEQVVMWTIIQTIWQKPDIIIAPLSIWWAPLSLKNAQRQSLRLWQRLINKPVIEAINGEFIHD